MPWAEALFHEARKPPDRPSQRLWWILYSLPRVAALSRAGAHEEAASALERAASRYAAMHHRLGIDACEIVGAHLNGTTRPEQLIESSFSRLPERILFK